MIVEIEHSKCGPIKLINPPVKYSRSQPTIRQPPPTLGQHTDEVLRALLDMEFDKIEALRRDGVIA